MIEARHAIWLRRLHGQASVALEDGSTLENRLASTKADTIELQVTLTQRGHPARLIAVRASPEVAARRRQEKTDKRKRNGTRPSKQASVVSIEKHGPLSPSSQIPANSSQPSSSRVNRRGSAYSNASTPSSANATSTPRTPARCSLWTGGSDLGVAHGTAMILVKAIDLDGQTISQSTEATVAATP